MSEKHPYVRTSGSGYALAVFCRTILKSSPRLYADKEGLVRGSPNREAFSGISSSSHCRLLLPALTNPLNIIKLFNLILLMSFWWCSASVKVEH